MKIQFGLRSYVEPHRNPHNGEACWFAIGFSVGTNNAPQINRMPIVIHFKWQFLVRGVLNHKLDWYRATPRNDFWEDLQINTESC
jgi:hypothetical protein